MVPFADSAELSIKLLENGTLRSIRATRTAGATINADVINADLLAFVQD